MSNGKLENKNIIKSMENNMYHKLQYIPAKINTMCVENLEDTLVIDSGLPSDTFNTAYGGSINQRKKNQVMEYYLNRKMPMAWWVGPASANGKNIQYDMESAGFMHDEFDIGMCCDLNFIKFDEFMVPNGLKIVECQNAQNFLDFGNVLASIFDPVDEYVKTFYQKIQDIPRSIRKDLVLFVGYVDNKPVSTSGLFITDVAGIYDISTRPEERGKGYGSAMFHRCSYICKKERTRHGSIASFT